jgi:hypothetical protein
MTFPAEDEAVTQLETGKYQNHEVFDHTKNDNVCWVEIQGQCESPGE